MWIKKIFFPDHFYYCLERDLWCEVIEAPQDIALSPIIRMGVTALGVRLSGHFFFCRPKPVGHELVPGANMAVVELNKSVVVIRSPLSGTITHVNQALVEQPELIEHDP